MCATAELNAMLQLPVPTLALQLCVPSLTVTVPVGVPLPGAFATTVNVKLTAWPTADGLGVCAVIVVVVPAAVTVWAVPADVLPANVPSPAYVAVSVFAPAVVGVRVQVPAATVPLHCTVPSLTVTLPVGVPPTDVTVKVTTTPCPTADGFGVWPVSVVVVPATPTVWASPADTLPVKFTAPPYVAVRIFAPGVRDASEQLPPATVPAQLTVPSLTGTLPAAAPLPGALTATL